MSWMKRLHMFDTALNSLQECISKERFDACLGVLEAVHGFQDYFQEYKQVEIVHDLLMLAENQQKLLQSHLNQFIRQRYLVKIYIACKSSSIFISFNGEGYIQDGVDKSKLIHVFVLTNLLGPEFMYVFYRCC